MKSLLLLCFSLFAINTTPIQWRTDFEKAKEEAAASQKRILLSFSGSDWCVPCIKMKKEIFDNAAFTDFANDKLILIKADFPRLKKNQLTKEQLKQNEMLAERYNKKGLFPYTVLLDAEGRVLKSWNGLPNMPAQEFVDNIRPFTK